MIKIQFAPLVFILLFGCAHETKTSKDSEARSSAISEIDRQEKADSLLDTHLMGYSSGDRLLNDRAESAKFEKKETKDYAAFLLTVKKNDLRAAQQKGAELLGKKNDDPIVLNGLARIYFVRGQKSRAEFLIAQVLQKNSSDVEALYLSGQMAWSDNKHELALLNFHKVHELVPEYKSVAFNLAVIYLRASVYASAVKYWSEVYQRQPNSQNGMALAQSHMGLGEYESAKNIYDQILRKTSFDMLKSQKNGLSLFDGYLRLVEQRPDSIAESTSLLQFVEKMNVAGLSERAAKLLKGP